MPMINGRKVGYGKAGMAKASRARAAGKKVTVRRKAGSKATTTKMGRRITAAGGTVKKKAGARISSAAGVKPKSLSKFSLKQKAAKAYGAKKKAHYAGMKKPNKALRRNAGMKSAIRSATGGAGGGGSKRKTLKRARAAGALKGRRAGHRARNF